MRAHRLGIPFLLLAVTACASGGGSSSGEPRRDRNRITAEELESLQVLTVWDAVQRSRPMWMRPGGIRNSANPVGYYASVFVDGSLYGELETMRAFRVADVEEIRFVSGTDATVRYGGQFQGGVILITTRR